MARAIGFNDVLALAAHVHESAAIRNMVTYLVRRAKDRVEGDAFGLEEFADGQWKK